MPSKIVLDPKKFPRKCGNPALLTSFGQNRSSFKEGINLHFFLIYFPENTKLNLMTWASGMNID